MERHTLLLKQRVSVGVTSLQWSSVYCFPPFLSFSGRAFLWSCSSFAVVVQLLSCVWLFVTPWTAACQASLSFTISQSLLKLMSIELVMPSNHLILCHPLLLLPSIFPCSRVFPNELALWFRWPKYWSFSISPSNGYSGLTLFRIDWFELPAVQGTLKSLLQHCSSKASILHLLILKEKVLRKGWCHPYR